MTKLGKGPVVVHYFGIPRLARGGPIKLLLCDAGVEFSEVHYTGDTWPAAKAKLIESGASPAGTVPVLQIGDKYYSQMAAILTYLASELGYNGHGSDEKYQLAAAADLITDAGGAKYRKDEEGWLKNLKALEKIIAIFHGSNDKGAFILGKKISHVDIVIFSVLHDNLPDDLSSYPKLQALYTAVKQREHIDKWLSSRASQ